MPFHKIINLNLKGKKSSFIHQEVNPVSSLTGETFLHFFVCLRYSLIQQKKFTQDFRSIM